MDERVVRALRAHERATFEGDADGLAGAERDLDAVEADLALARAKVGHAGFQAGGEEDPGELEHLERAVELYARIGDRAGEAEARCWIGIYHQVVRRDNATAVPVLERARELAARSGDARVLSYALRHLGVAEHVAGRLDAARGYLEESTRLRREIGFPAGVAANLVGLIYLAAARNDLDLAAGLADEAHELAEQAGATAIVRQVAEARGVL
ncbi:MAG: tetratricopeptide repeat protein [Actinoplanes sp.]